MRNEVWEKTIAEMINVPVNFMRLLSVGEHSEAEGTENAWLFSLDEEPAGLTGLGIDLAKFIMEGKK